MDKKNLQDPKDYLYFDNVNLEGKIGEAKYPYNSGQMLQAAALLYNITKDQQYLDHAQKVAASGYDFFSLILNLSLERNSNYLKILMFGL